MSSPSKRRRQGRDAFDSNTDPMDIQPYKKGSWHYDYYLSDWLEGWFEAEKVFDKYHSGPKEIICKCCGQTAKE